MECSFHKIKNGDNGGAKIEDYEVFKGDHFQYVGFMFIGWDHSFALTLNLLQPPSFTQTWDT